MLSFNARKQQAGFLLYETLSALTVAGILSATAVPYLLDLNEKALESSLISSASSLQSAARMYRAKWLTSGQFNIVPGFRLRANQSGIPAGYGSFSHTSDADCQLIWNELIESPVEFNLESTGEEPAEIIAQFEAHSWQWHASAARDSAYHGYCEFTLESAQNDASSPRILFSTHNGHTLIASR